MEKSLNSTYKYYCIYCNYSTYSLKDYNKHLSTTKHINRVFLEQKIPKNPNLFICDKCNKSYKARNSLWYHQKKCVNSEKNKNEENPIISQFNPLFNISNEVVIELIKDNKEMKEIISGLVKNGIYNNHSHNTTNSHNKSFNLNFFLNETCKDAMNITDFVDSIKLQLSDLIEIGEIGYVEGISNIIIKNLNNLDETKRPVHCTDKKRETIYIKDEGLWQKEDQNKSKLRKSIRNIADKNIRLLPQFREKYPECRLSESSISNKYCKMIIEVMGGMGNNNKEKEEKIIKNITKITTINKF